MAMVIAAPETMKLEALVESLLFVADGPVTLTRLAETLGVDPAVVATTLASLDAHLANRGLRLMRSAAGFQLVSAPDAGVYVERFLGLGGSRLSTAALETLAIIAYRQPVTRAQIEAIRGVNVDRSLHTLLGKGLVEEVGRLETAGRPILFGTTDEFLQYFGLSSLDEMPDIVSLGLPVSSR
jgi:segregation and condensation protein B